MMMVGHHLSYGHVKVPAENSLCPAFPLPGYLKAVPFNYRAAAEVSLWVWKGLPQLSTSRGDAGVSWRHSQPKAEKPVLWCSFPQLSSTLLFPQTQPWSSSWRCQLLSTSRTCPVGVGKGAAVLLGQSRSAATQCTARQGLKASVRTRHKRSVLGPSLNSY